MRQPDPLVGGHALHMRIAISQVLGKHGLLFDSIGTDAKLEATPGFRSSFLLLSKGLYLHHFRAPLLGFLCASIHLAGGS